MNTEKLIERFEKLTSPKERAAFYRRHKGRLYKEIVKDDGAIKLLLNYEKEFIFDCDVGVIGSIRFSSSDSFCR